MLAATAAVLREQRRRGLAGRRQRPRPGTGPLLARHRRGGRRRRPRRSPARWPGLSACPGSPSPRSTGPTEWWASRLTWMSPPLRGGGILADLAERDFTINAMALSARAAASLIDPFGGLTDLRARRLRAVSTASSQADPLRLMRAARFAHVLSLGSGPRLEAGRAAAGRRVGRAAAERVVTEMILTLDAGRAGDAARLWHELGLLQAVAAGDSGGRREQDAASRQDLWRSRSPTSAGRVPRGGGALARGLTGRWTGRSSAG